MDAKADADAFVPARDATVNGIDYHLEWKEGHPSFTDRRGTQPAETYTAEFVLGHTPLRQYVVPVAVAYQAAELTFDPRRTSVQCIRRGAAQQANGALAGAGDEGTRVPQSSTLQKNDTWPRTLRATCASTG